MTVSELLALEIAGGRTVGDLLSLDLVFSVLGSVLSAILILVAGYILGGWLAKRIRRIADRFPDIDMTVVSFASNAVRYAILGLAFLFVLNTFGVQTASIVAVIGSVGLAIGLALQGTLSNVASGVMLVFFRPFRVGDFVEVGGQMGTVKEITINFTELATVANVKVLIPNSSVWGNTITNYSAYDTRRAEWTFGVSYGADLALAERVIRDTIMADPRSMAEPEPFIKVNGLNQSSVDFLVRVWVASADHFAYQADMKRAVKEALDAAGVEIPFPTRTVYLRQDEAEAAQ